MKNLAVAVALCLLGACASSTSPKPIKYSCSQSPEIFVENAARVFRNNGYEVRETDYVSGEIVGFKPERMFMMGDVPIKAGPYLVKAQCRNDTLTILVFTVKDDEKTPERSWDETATDEFERSQYMPLLGELRALCRREAQ
jgi:hypothetical protein